MTIVFLQPDGVPITAQAERQGSAALYGGGSGRQLGGRSGFRVGTPADTLTATATTWTLKPCSAMIDPGASTHQGMYGWASDSNVTGSVTASDATYARKDIVYIQVNDSTAGDGSGATNANPAYLAGTPSATPAAPTLPARSFLVGTIDVPKTGAGSPTVTLNPARFVAAGGILPVGSQAAQDALTHYPASEIIRTDDRFKRYVSDGTKWVLPAEAQGRIAESVQPASFDGFSGGEFFADGIPSVSLKAGRKYRIDYRFSVVAPTGANVGMVFNFKRSFTTDTGVAGNQIESPIVWSPPVANSNGSLYLTVTYTPAADETVRILVTSGRVAGSSLYNLSARTLTVTDEGAQF